MNISNYSVLWYSVPAVMLHDYMEAEGGRVESCTKSRYVDMNDMIGYHT